MFDESTKYIPLAERLRPRSIKDMIGQEHLIGDNGPIAALVKSKALQSLIFWGPPGVGKTTVSKIIAEEIGIQHYQLSAIDSGVKEVRNVIEAARRQGGAILFIDEIHRFSKSQQDALLGAVEKGTIKLIGATTENPSFEVNNALLSRSQVYKLEPLEKRHLQILLDKALKNDKYLSKKRITIEDPSALFRFSGGDARRLLNLIELVVNAAGVKTVVFNKETVEKVVQSKAAQFDKKGENHYDIASAMIKSIRGSDPNAAVYWLARMLEGGEDPKFIARRILISASEDIGNANPNALLLANSTFDAVAKIGMPESRIILSQCVTYLASCQKSNAAYNAINQAQQLVRETGDLEVPLHLRNASTKLMKEIGYGEDYKYSHDFPGSFVEQEYLPNEISGTKLYDPKSDNPSEAKLKGDLKNKWKDKYGY